MAVPLFTNGTAPSKANFGWWINTRPLMAAVGASKSVSSGSYQNVAMDSVVCDRYSGMTYATGHYVIGLELGHYYVEGFVQFSSSTSGSTRKVGIGGTYTGFT